MSESGSRGRVGDEAVLVKTGKSWDEWFALLDAAGAASMTHPQIVAQLGESHDIGSWWQQTVAVEYEKARGLRAKHEKPTGFEIGASKTLPVPVEALFDAWGEDRRGSWLEGEELSIHRATRPKSMRGRWAPDDSRVDLYFTAKGTTRSQIAVQHGHLADPAKAEHMKAFWRRQLGRLAEHLAG